MNLRSRHCLPFVLASFALVRAQDRSPGYVLYNAKIFTASSAQPYVQALAIQGNRILAAGTTQNISALATARTIRLDLGGRVVVPGFNDAHFHFGAGPPVHALQLSGQDPAWTEVEKQIAAAVAGTSKDTIIAGTIGVRVLEEPQANRATLDRLAPDHAVSLAAWTGHASIFNSAYMRKLGLRDDEPDPPAGHYTRDSAGKLTGRADEYAEFGLGPKMGRMVSSDRQLAQAKRLFDEALQFGVTSIQTMAPGRDETASLLRRAEAPIRFRVIDFPLTAPNGRWQPPATRVAGLVTISGLKWILDGTPIERSAAMRAPYADQRDAGGAEDFTPAEMQAMLRQSQRTGEQLLVHIVGDRSAEDFLNAMQATGGAAAWRERRVRIEHGDGLTPDLIPRVKQLGAIVVQNPTHFTIGDLLQARFGPERAAKLQPVRSLVDAGIPLAIGSDGPLNPFVNLMFAVANPFRLAESLTREQAVTAYTLQSAYAEFAEKEKGSLETGKLADLAVLSQDIFTIPVSELPKTVSLLTMVDGKIVYNRLK